MTAHIQSTFHNLEKMQLYMKDHFYNGVYIKYSFMLASNQCQRYFTILSIIAYQNAHSDNIRNTC